MCFGSISREVEPSGRMVARSLEDAVEVTLAPCRSLTPKREPASVELEPGPAARVAYFAATAAIAVAVAVIKEAVRHIPAEAVLEVLATTGAIQCRSFYAL